MLSRKGFTLTQIMIVVAIIGILVAIAYPSYNQHTQRVKRTDVQAEMMTIAQKLESRRIANGTYLNSDSARNTIESIYGSSTSPQQGTPLYTLAFTTLNATTWVLTATPITTAAQNGNGIICLNDQGQKFWQKAATTCNFSNLSNWDGR